MATIKSYTDLEQSRKLAEILPLESADMYYDRGRLPSLIDKYVTHESIKNDKYHHLIPCWSLASLLGVFPRSEYKDIYLCYGGYEGNKYIPEWFCSYEQQEPFILEICCADNPVDAIVELILKLNELNLL